MELVELRLSNFRRFVDERFEFGPGLTLFWGPNESGKSTIHDAVYCALFGRDRGKAVENWNGGACSVALAYRNGSKTYSIERRLTEGVVKLGVRSDGGLTDVISSKDEIARTLADHMGINSRSVLDNTVSVRQMDMSTANTSEMKAVGAEIQRVLTGTANVSASEALRWLENARDTIKGRARPVNPREYDTITDRLHKLAAELAAARNSRQQVRNHETELADLDSRIERDSHRFGDLEELLDRHKRWAELKKRESELDGLHESAFGTVRKLKEILKDLADVQKELEDYSDLVGRDEEIEEQLAGIVSRRAELTERIQAFERMETSEAEGKCSTMLAILAAVLAVAGIAGGILLHPLMYLMLIPAVIFGLAVVLKRLKAHSGESSQVAEMIRNSRRELEQLAVDEASVLSYVKCSNAALARVRIKNYRATADQARELEVALRALLGGRRPEDWEKQEADLGRELTSIRRELEDDFPGYSPATREVESWRSEYSALQSTLPKQQARRHVVSGSLDTERRNARDLAALEGELEYMHGRKAELEFLYRAYDEAISSLTTVTQTVSEEYLPSISESASEFMNRLTSGRYSSVQVKPGWEISLDCADRSEVQPPSLSAGTLDQLYLALRISCGELLSSGRKLPLIMDDPFATFDPDRLSNALRLLEMVAADGQIVLMAHDPNILAWADGLRESRIPCMIHKLSRP